MSVFRRRRPTELDRSVELVEDAAALDDATLARLARLVVPRLVLAHEVPASMHPHTEPFVPGLYALIAVKLRMGTTVVPPEDFWSTRGGFQHWWAIALGNLTRLFDDPETEYRRVPTDGLVLSSFMGLSRDLAGLVLRFGDLMDHLGVADHGSGFLVMLPQRQQIFWHAIEGTESIDFVRSAATVAFLNFRDTIQEVRLSPLVYWVRGDRWEPVTALREDGIGLVPSDELLAALGLGQSG